MSVELFVLFLGLVFAALFIWSFKTLPQEGWQILASVPLTKVSDDQWQGLNLTFYGFFIANSCVAAVVILLILLGSIGVSLSIALGLIIVVMGICLPAARLIARIVEKKAFTFTVGGASFVGGLLLPWLLILFNRLIGEQMGTILPIPPALAAVSIAYALGEGMGRLACISFGCCYGKPVDDTNRRVRLIFQSLSFTFRGETKKASYEGGFNGVQLVPIQGITAVLYVAIALVGTLLFLKLRYVSAAMVTVVATQLWRSVSEFFRADYRGASKISAYQIMALIMIGYISVVISLVGSQGTVPVSLISGVEALWNPLVLIFLLIVWFSVFLYTGRSMVTGSTLSFCVRHDRI